MSVTHRFRPNIHKCSFKFDTMSRTIFELHVQKLSVTHCFRLDIHNSSFEIGSMLSTISRNMIQSSTEELWISRRKQCVTLTFCREAWKLCVTRYQLWTNICGFQGGNDVSRLIGGRGSQKVQDPRILTPHFLTKPWIIAFVQITEKPQFCLFLAKNPENQYLAWWNAHEIPFTKSMCCLILSFLLLFPHCWGALFRTVVVAKGRN